MLPRTFQDAIQVTRGLGVRYIWIDALCIVQDDHQDWEREAGEMATIYHNSFLTITGAAAESPEAGLFSTNSSLMLNSAIVQLIHHFPNSRTDPRQHPLLNRAWTYQERMLAPRVLHFGREEVSWECSERLQCECGIREDYFRDEVSKSDFFDTIIESVSTDYQNPQQMWRQIVVEYSPLALTVPSDKLPALSGLAEKMRSSTKQTYLAGLWKETLALDLLWYIDSQYALTPRRARLPSVWRAPSWSWASIDGQIMYDHTLYTGSSYKVYKGVNVFIEVISAECTSKGCSVTGEVSGGYLRLAASILPLSYHGVSYHKPKLMLQNQDVGFQSDGRTDLGGVDLYAVRIAQLPPTKWTHDVCLVVTPLDASRDKFIRVGLATLYSLKGEVNSLMWPERTEITII